MLFIAISAREKWAIAIFDLIRYLPQTIKTVVPAKAGIQPGLGMWHWIPAFAEMTRGVRV
jgi:hypothetical protein